MTRRSMAGVTLVEVAVFSLIGLVFVMIALGLFRSSARDAARLDRHLEGVQAVQALLDRVTADLVGAYRFERRAAGLTCEMTASPDGRALELFAFDALVEQPEEPVAQDGTVAPIKLDRITYRFDAAAHTVSRQVGDARPEPLRAGRYLSVKFELATTSPPAPSGVALSERDQLVMAVEWLPEPELARAPADRGDVLAFRATLGAPGQSAARAHPAVVLEPTSKFVY